MIWCYNFYCTITIHRLKCNHVSSRNTGYRWQYYLAVIHIRFYTNCKRSVNTTSRQCFQYFINIAVIRIRSSHIFHTRHWTITSNKRNFGCIVQWFMIYKIIGTYLQGIPYPRFDTFVSGSKLSLSCYSYLCRCLSGQRSQPIIRMNGTSIYTIIYSYPVYSSHTHIFQRNLYYCRHICISSQRRVCNSLDSHIFHQWEILNHSKLKLWTHVG